MPNKFNHARRHHISKQKYKITNWSEYNAALKNRGRIDIFICEKLLANWSKPRIHDGHGSSQHYSEQAILACHQLRMVFHLPLRQTQGFVESLFSMMKIKLSVPAISTLCDRLKSLGMSTPDFKNKPAKIDDIFAIAIDSTGLKQYGRDEWHQEKHKVKSKASWRKAHFAVGDDHLIYAAKMTDKNTWDHEVVGDLVTQINVPVDQFFGDKGYDENAVYETVTQVFPEADIVIPPKITSRIKTSTTQNAVRIFVKFSSQDRWPGKKNISMGNGVWQKWRCNVTSGSLEIGFMHENLSVRNRK